MRAELAARPLRDYVSPSPDHPLLVERERALYGAWYEIFPRSEGAVHDPVTGRWKSGTLRTAAQRLPAVAGMGFDVIYLTPIHPIGTTAQKGPNNTLHAGPDDPGSPYAIGSPDGGHDAIHPDLGTFDDFDHFVAEAERHGLEVALDIALQCSPDHPYVAEHPEWFTTRADGTIAYAENPPKKYQDIYPLNFDNDPQGAYAEMRRMIQVWIDHGVKIFRVDNPHTKPVEFWQWLIDDVAVDHPDVIWLAEAFTKPAMMHTLGKVGFQQSYTYYAWRQPEVGARGVLPRARRRRGGLHASVLLADDARHPHAVHAVRRPDRLEAARSAGRHARADLRHLHRVRAHRARGPPGRRGADRQREVPVQGPALGGLRARRTQGGAVPRRLPHAAQRDPPGAPGPAPAAQHPVFHHVDDSNIMAFSKRRTLPDGSEDIIIVVANLDPHSTRESTVHLDMPALGFDYHETFAAHDLITDESWHWGEHNYVRLGPAGEPVHVIAIRRFCRCRDSTCPSRGSSTTRSGSRPRSSTRCSSAPSATPTAAARVTSPA